MTITPDPVHDDNQEPHLTPEEQEEWDRKVAEGDVLGEDDD
jgi:hypothetical protein